MARPAKGPARAGDPAAIGASSGNTNPGESLHESRDSVLSAEGEESRAAHARFPGIRVPLAFALFLLLVEPLPLVRAGARDVAARRAIGADPSVNRGGPGRNRDEPRPASARTELCRSIASPLLRASIDLRETCDARRSSPAPDAIARRERGHPACPRRRSRAAPGHAGTRAGCSSLLASGGVHRSPV